MADRIEHTLPMELLLAPEEPVALRTRLAYRRRDPFAVHITFHTGVHAPVSWVFARDLLALGMRERSGLGDVRVWPQGSGPDAVLNLTLSSPHGSARLRASLPAMAEWLERTYLLVPAGGESDELRLDAALSRLLHGAA
ncbi:SsgA family sporulation/cell division regulator [Streptomyces sp. NBC_00820]|uniref:SsgA family sporulation/cell division regulator n=1 Tax=Streptomyces sp. NBC_00820 TaxID=2975842 RepID=UPI002ED4DF0E|nr:SsgA family sporulation/cell division regulator [Streptomyces sp. NBC_00820]